MTDIQIRDRLRAAVGDTTAPPAFAHSIVQRGRARRRRRYAAASLAAAAVVVASAVVIPGGNPLAGGDDAASTRNGAADLEWARSLPTGPAPAVPFFGEGGLWDAGQQVTVPANVNRSIPPKRVAGGWLVFLGLQERSLATAVLGPEGSLRRLPTETYDDGMGDARVMISPDGTRAALGRWVVDLASMQPSVVPHTPEREQQRGYYTTIRMVGFTEQGLVYEGAPFARGLGTTYLLGDDGTAIELDPPGDSTLRDGPAADVALAIDGEDDADTCVSSWLLRDSAWQPRPNGCMGKRLREAFAVSPGGDWLLTDDLPRVWDLADGEWAEVEVPSDLARSWGDTGGFPTWEDGDSFLLPISDPDVGTDSEPFTQTSQVVRCTVTTGTCERAGVEQQVDVEFTWSGSTSVKFAW